MRTKLLLLTILNAFLWSQTVLCQLSGSYTIGGVNPDFNTIAQAINALDSAGAVSDVTFNLRSGIYDERIIVPSIPNYTYTFQSENLDSSSVIWMSSDTIGMTFQCNSFEKFRFVQLTIIDNVYGAVYNYGDSEFFNCIINCPNYAIYTHRGINLQNNLIEGDIKFYDVSVLDSNTIIGNIDGSYCQLFTNNTVTGEVDLSQGCEFIGNSITGDIKISRDTVIFKNNFNSFGEIRFSLVDSAAFISNTNFGDVSINADKLITESNFVYGEFYVSSDFPSVHISNTINGLFEINRSNNSTVLSNKIFGTLSISYSDSVKIYNNFIFGDTEFSFSGYNHFKFNNIANDSDPWFDVGISFHNIIEFNNMPALFRIDNNNTLINNNYPYGFGYSPFNQINDPNPTFIDPLYVSTTDLHITNPQLTGTAILDSLISVDIDYNPRSLRTAIGADEICFSGDTLNAYCGDSIVLVLCNFTSDTNLIWTPSLGLSNEFILSPTLMISNNTWYIVTDTITGESDSVYINVVPFIVHAGSDDSTRYCGNSLFLHASFHNNATYQWTPIDSVVNSNSYFTYVDPSQTTAYIVTASISGCGSSTDTVIVFVDSAPIAYTYLDSVNNNYFQFLNVSLCADNYFWDFGDSTSSIDIHPAHIYPDTGYFLVTLIAYNIFDSDTFQGFIYVDSVSFSTNDSEIIEENEFSIFPNPANDILTITYPNQKKLTIEIIIYNSLGREVFRENNLSEKTLKIPISHFLTGIYFIQISNELETFSKKLIKL